MFSFLKKLRRSKNLDQTKELCGEDTTSAKRSDSQLPCQQKPEQSTSVSKGAVRKASLLDSLTITEGLEIGDIAVGNCQYNNVTNYNYGPPGVAENKALAATYNTTDCIKTLRKGLTAEYEKITLPNVAWMHNGCLTIGSYFVDLKLSETGCNIELRHIFDEIKVKVCNGERNIKPSRIFIESPAGYGKTSLAYKIAYDWAMKEKYTKRFKLTFLLTLRQIEGPILEEISGIAKMHGFDNVENVINNSGTLLILDGYDELRSSYKENVLQILFKNEFRDATVIVTCRSGTCVLSDEHKNKLAVHGHKTNQFYDKKVEIMGLNDKARRKLLDGLINKKKEDKIINRIEEIIEPVQSLFDCPLCVILLAAIVDEHDTLVVETKTGLFKSIMNYLIRRSLEKNNAQWAIEDAKNLWSSNGNLFDSDNYNTQIEEKLDTFGKSAIGQIVTEVLQFECNADYDRIYEMGLLIKHETKKKFNTLTHYEIFHLSFLEFAAAISLWVAFKRGGKQFSEETVGVVNILFSKKGDSSLVIPFLFGLMGENAHLLFDALRPYSGFYSTSRCHLSFILKECQVTDCLIKSVSPFIPPITRNDEITTLLKPLLDKNADLTSTALDRSELPTILIISDLNAVSGLPKNLNCMYISIIFGKTSFCQVHNAHVNGLKCDKLQFYFKTSVIEINDLLAATKLFHVIEANDKILRFDEDVGAVILEHSSGNLIGEGKVSELHCRLNSSRESFAMIKSVTDNNKLEKLHLKVASGFYLTSVVSLISKSVYLTTLCLLNVANCDEVTLDLSELTQNGRKQWRELNFAGVDIRCNSPFVFSKCVTKFTIVDCHCESDVFNSVGMDILHCSYNCISNMQDAAFNVNGLNSLHEIAVIFKICNENQIELESLMPVVSCAMSRDVGLKIVIGGSITDGTLRHTCGSLKNAFVSEIVLNLDDAENCCRINESISELYNMLDKNLFTLDTFVLVSVGGSFASSDLISCDFLLSLIDERLVKKINVIVNSNVECDLDKFSNYHVLCSSMACSDFSYMFLTNHCDADMGFYNNISITQR